MSAEMDTKEKMRDIILFADRSGDQWWAEREEKKWGKQNNNLDS